MIKCSKTACICDITMFIKCHTQMTHRCALRTRPFYLFTMYRNSYQIKDNSSTRFDYKINSWIVSLFGLNAFAVFYYTPLCGHCHTIRLFFFLLVFFLSNQNTVLRYILVSRLVIKLPSLLHYIAL